ASPRCTGPAPLELTLVPITEGITDYIWSAPGATPASSMAISPVVRYDASGSYSVTLVAGGPAGSVMAVGTVLATAGALGDPCGRSEDCEPTLSCLCAGGAGCPPALAGGVCTRACGAGCGAGAECVDLGRAA